MAKHAPTGVPTLNDADHPLYAAASAALGVANGRQSGNAMNEAVAAMAKRSPVLAAAPDLLNAAKETIRNSWLSSSMLVACSSVRRGAEVSETDRSLAKVYKLLADAIDKAEGR